MIMEKSINEEKQIWNIVRCSWCKKCFDKETREIVPEPTEGTVMSHTVCKECMEKLTAGYQEWMDAEVANIHHLIFRDRGFRYRLFSRKTGGR